MPLRCNWTHLCNNDGQEWTYGFNKTLPIIARQVNDELVKGLMSVACQTRQSLNQGLGYICVC